jgi:hypothetical protein
VQSLETLLAAIIDAQRALDAPPRPTSFQVAEATAYLGLLSDAEERWFRPAVRAGGV